MKITALVENTTNKPNVGAEHGLSLLIESDNKVLLFDTGASDLFAKNALALEEDLSRVDFAVLSHGHHDHGGGLSTFFSLNTKAPLYVRKEAFGPYYSQRSDGQFRYIGLEQSLLGSNRLIFTSAFTPITEGFSLFSKVEGKQFVPMGNQSLYKQEEQTFLLDSFTHEQYLVVEEKGKTVLVSGCSHRGVVNILRTFQTRYGRNPDLVIGGFHLYDHSSGEREDANTLNSIADILLESGALYVTCHCTGEENYLFLKNLMGEHISYLHGGDVLQEVYA
ncbi:MBL fold metallo-hydrolase [Sphaerochaeta sp.]|uniref:MBL fold metallo-hydrolase n=1 Tax=Sphaerochaeta sp. TaxID=1972642 RepID=UPI002FC89354